LTRDIAVSRGESNKVRMLSRRGSIAEPIFSIGLVPFHHGY